MNKSTNEIYGNTHTHNMKWNKKQYNLYDIENIKQYVYMKVNIESLRRITQSWGKLEIKN